MMAALNLGSRSHVGVEEIIWFIIVLFIILMVQKFLPNVWERANINSTNTDYWVAGGTSFTTCTPSYNPVIGTLNDLTDCIAGANTFGYIAPITTYMHNHADVTIKAHPYYANNVQYPNHHLIGNTYHGSDSRFISP